VFRDSQAELWATVAVLQELMFYFASRPSGLLSVQRRLTLYILARRLQKQKAKLNPHVDVCDFIGYFIFPGLCGLLHVLIL
jgi:hypothetical protein